MKNVLVFVFLLSIPLKSFAVAVGEKASLLRDTYLMSVHTKVALVKKGQLVDVLKVDPKSPEWFYTEIEQNGELKKGWLLHRNAVRFPELCAPGYLWECKNVLQQKCVIESEPGECKTESVYECRYEYGHNPATGEYEMYNKCEFVPKEVCYPNKYQKCWNESVKQCFCRVLGH